MDLDTACFFGPILKSKLCIYVLTNVWILITVSSSSFLFQFVLVKIQIVTVKKCSKIALLLFFFFLYLLLISTTTREISPALGLYLFFPFNFICGNYVLGFLVSLMK